MEHTIFDDLKARSVVCFFDLTYMVVMQGLCFVALVSSRRFLFLACLFIRLAGRLTNLIDGWMDGWIDGWFDRLGPTSARGTTKST